MDGFERETPVSREVLSGYQREQKCIFTGLKTLF